MSEDEIGAETHSQRQPVDTVFGSMLQQHSQVVVDVNDIDAILVGRLPAEGVCLEDMEPKGVLQELQLRNEESATDILRQGGCRQPHDQ